MKTAGFRIHAFGGPEALRWESYDLPDPPSGSVRVRHSHVGLNYIDVYDRTGQFPVGPLPAVIGHEAAGVVEAIGADVDRTWLSRRVAYVAPPVGSYSEAANVPASRLVSLPDPVSTALAAAVLLKGMTAEYLTHRAAPVGHGDVVLLHAAAGGVGVLITRWCKALGATVIGTVGSPAKVEAARGNGCDHVILYTRDDFVSRVREITNGRGADVVYDSVGGDVFHRSLDCLRPRGSIANFGNAAGPVGALDVDSLGPRGAFKITRTTLFAYTGAPADLALSSGRLFRALADGQLHAPTVTYRPLADAPAAHRALEARETIGITAFEVPRYGK